MKIRGTFLGTTATLYLGLGFVPTHFRMINQATNIGTEWDRMWAVYGTSAQYYGMSIAAAGDKAAITSAAYGVVTYAGGDQITSVSTAYKVALDKDQRDAYSTAAPIKSFTIGSVSNKTGNFDVEASTATVGPGSIVRLANDPNAYAVLALSSNGEAANEVTLDSIPAGAAAGSVFYVARITPRYTMFSAPVGQIMPAGLVIGASNVSNTAYPVWFEADDGE